MKPANGLFDLQYNTGLEELIMPEYGRNVQQLVRHAQTIKDHQYRQAFCEQIVDLIQQLYPQSKNIDDYREKLWKHLFHIAKYNLEAYTPSGEVPRPEDAKKKPERVPYPLQDTRFRHYGNNVQVLIRRALEMEPGAIKDGFVQAIGSYMKLAYKTWNKEHFVSDEIIKNDLAILSANKLSLEDASSIDNLANANKNRGNSANKNMGTNDRERRPNNNNPNNRTNNNNNSSNNNKNRPNNPNQNPNKSNNPNNKNNNNSNNSNNNNNRKK
ncbi:MAG: hypothetical protein RLZZ628_165 [Bacteroidota bacterium]